jgi:Dolichyl-phosphate-mannose-protein mannosyltransferase
MTPGPTARRRAAVVSALALVAVVLVGAGLRVSGIRFGDPFVYHPDEWIIARPAMTMAATGDWNPHDFQYPSLLTDLEAIVASVMHAAGGAALDTGQPWLYQNELVPDQFGYVLAGRLLVVLLGTATILVVFETTRRLVGLAGALAAAAIVALVPLAVEHAHYLTTDIPMTFLCALCLLATVVASRDRRRRWWLVAALLAGLAGSTKWNGLAVAVVPLLAYVVTRLERAHPLAILRDPLPFAMIGAILVGFIAPTPAILLAPEEVTFWLASSAAIYAVPDPRQTQDTLTFNTRTLVDTLGPLVVWCMVGMVVLVARLRDHPAERAAVAIPAFVVVYLLLATLPSRHYARNLLPIIPFLAVAGGIAAATLLEHLRRRSAGPPRLPRWSAAVIVGSLFVISLLPPAASSLAVTAGLSRPDTRDAARAWMLEHVPPGTTVAREIYTPQFDEREFTPAGSFFLPEVSLDGYRARGVRYLIASSWAYERFVGKPATPVEDAFYRDLFALPEAFRIDPGPNRAGPTIRILSLDAPAD